MNQTPGTALLVGERIRLTREDRNLSQGGLAALCPHGPRGPRTANWMSGIEGGKQEPSLGDLIAIADVLHVSAGWLLTGEDSGDSEFIARLRGLEDHMDDRGRRVVLANAEREAEEYRLAQVDKVSEHVERLVSAGFPRAEAQRAAEVLLGTARSSASPDVATEEEPPLRASQ